MDDFNGTELKHVRGGDGDHIIGAVEETGWGIEDVGVELETSGIGWGEGDFELGEVGEGGEGAQGRGKIKVLPEHVEADEVTVVVTGGTAVEAVPATVFGVEVESGGVVAVVERAVGGVAAKSGAGLLGEGTEGEAGAEGVDELGGSRRSHGWLV